MGPIGWARGRQHAFSVMQIRSQIRYFKARFLMGPGISVCTLCLLANSHDADVAACSVHNLTKETDMNLVYTVLIAFPLGYFIQTRSTALLSYLLAGSYLFSYQNVGVILDWLGHVSPSAFGPFPEDFPAKASTSETIGYGVINLVITVVGIGLVILGHRVATRRRAKKNPVAAVR